MKESTDIVYSEALRISICPTCRESHALPRLCFVAAAAERRPIFCHAGHSYVPGDPDKPDSNALLSNIALSAALADARAQVVTMGRLVAAFTPGKEPDTKEIRRRANVLASRAQGEDFGRCVCQFCGKQKSLPRMSEHLRRSHRMEISDMPPSAFD